MASHERGRDSVELDNPGRWQVAKTPRPPIGTFLAAIAGFVIAIAVVAGLLHVRTTHSSATGTGNGVVVIETNLGYPGGQAAGTGIVLTSSGEVLTNNHVIRGATTIKVIVPGTGKHYTAKVVGYSTS